MKKSSLLPSRIPQSQVLSLVRSSMGFCRASDGKESAYNAGDLGSISGSGRKIPWGREWLPTPVFLPGELRGQRSLVGCSPWGLKKSKRTERLNDFHTSIFQVIDALICTFFFFFSFLSSPIWSNEVRLCSSIC